MNNTIKKATKSQLKIDIVKVNSGGKDGVKMDLKTYVMI